MTHAAAGTAHISLVSNQISKPGSSSRCLRTLLPQPSNLCLCRCRLLAPCALPTPWPHASRPMRTACPPPQAYCLPDNYEVVDRSMDDIRDVLNPRFNRQQVRGAVCLCVQWGVHVLCVGGQGVLHYRRRPRRAQLALQPAAGGSKLAVAKVAQPQSKIVLACQQLALLADALKMLRVRGAAADAVIHIRNRCPSWIRMCPGCAPWTAASTCPAWWGSTT